MPSDQELQPIAEHSSKSLDEIRVSKTRQIEQHKAVIAEIFEPHRDKLEFRAFLRNHEAYQLEDILFGEHVSPLELKCSPVTEEAIAQAFEQLNREYNYFSHQDLKRFKLFFKICQFIADVVEHNNSSDNRVALLHAYKLMVLFKEDNPNRPFDSIDTFLSLHSLTLSKYFNPIHDLLIHDIPHFLDQPPMPPNELKKWQILIHAGGPKAIDLFQQAKAINKHLGRSPNSLDEAQAILAKLAYPRADENPKLASLCLKYHLSEDDFNKCLVVEEKRKTRDILPPCHINGADVGHPGYFLVKLPIEDLRAYFLGHLTNCCQSIGGDSEQCVIDGITRANCGFYVLLKGPTEALPMTADGQINEAFKIVGQGYAWLSTNDVLVFDSWENLRWEDNPIIDCMLRHFSAQLTSKEDFYIVAVSIGKGGKTPKTFSQNATQQHSVVIHEMMKEGEQYNDSKDQWAIAFNMKLFAQLRHVMIVKLEAAIARGFPALQSMVTHLAKNPQEIGLKDIYFPNQQLVQHIEQLFLQEDSHYFWGQVLKNDYTKLSMLAKYSSKILSLWQILVMIKELNLLDKTKDSFEFILKHPDMSKLLETLIFLQKHDFLSGEQTQANFERIVTHQNLSTSLKTLSIAQKSRLFSGELAQTNFEMLITHQNQMAVADILSIIDKTQLFIGNFEAIITHQDLTYLNIALEIGQQSSLFIGKHAQTNLEAIMKHPKIELLSDTLGIAKLNFLFSQEEAQSNFEAIINHPNLYPVLDTLCIGLNNNLIPQKKSQAYFKTIITHQNLQSVACALLITERNYLFIGEQAQAHFEALITHQNPRDVTTALYFAQKNSLLTEFKKQINFVAITQHKDISRLLSDLKESPTQTTLDLVISNGAWITEQHFFKKHIDEESGTLPSSPRAFF